MKKYLTCGIIAIISLLIGRYVLQPKQKVQIKEVIKYVEKKQETSKKKKKITKKETINSDGSSTTETTITEDSSSSTDTEVNYQKDSEKKIASGRGVSIGVLAVTEIDKFRKKPDVAVFVTVPIIGNLSVATMLDSSKRAGVGLSLEF